MKRILIIALLLAAIPALRAQKKEIKKAQMDVKAGNYTSAASYLDQAKRIFAAADSKTRAEYYVVEAEMRLAEKKLDGQRIELISKSLKRANNYELTPTLQQRILQVNLKINKSTATIADGEFANKNYSKAASLYEIAYQSAKDTVHLLKAAKSHLLAKEYNEAYKTYSNLVNIGYTNAKVQYAATNVKTNKRGIFSSAKERNKAIAGRLYNNPEIITSHSRLPEILRGLIVASKPLDKNNETVAIIDRVLAKMPENKMLRNQASFLYIELGAIDKYYTIIDQLIKETPNDPSIYYNSAVTSEKNKDIDRAKSFYKKALKIDPNYINAKINLSMLLLEQDKVLTNEMNELGMSETDDLRYKELKQKRNKLHDEVIPYLESIVKSQPQNKDFSKKLKAIYSFKGESTNIATIKED